jgi:hypothetical protein
MMRVIINGRCIHKSMQMDNSIVDLTYTKFPIDELVKPLLASPVYPLSKVLICLA